jgi:hypothetical protein
MILKLVNNAVTTAKIAPGAVAVDMLASAVTQTILETGERTHSIVYKR